VSKIRNQTTTAVVEPSPPPSVPIGDRVVALLEIAYRARRPLLLEGPTGIGKSQIVAQFAARIGIQCKVLDLSLMEPPDLIGLPQLRDGRTHYAYPAELPIDGRGVLMLEELNRAEIPVMQPALQLLSARRLHEYELPAGWMCVAAINPEQDEYQVNRLDPALRSRFLQVPVHADRDEWLRWARSHNLHPVVLSLIAENPTVFESTAPRSWSYLAELLQALSVEEQRRRELVLTLARGYLSTPWATAVAEAFAGLPETPRLDCEALFGEQGERYFAQLISELMSKGRSDAVTLLAWEVGQLVGGADQRGAPWIGGLRPDRLARLLAPLPGDLRVQCLAQFSREAAVANADVIR
jgi:hypothetical protein